MVKSPSTGDGWVCADAEGCIQAAAAFDKPGDHALQAYRNRPYESDLALDNYDVLVNTGMGALRDHEATDEISSIISAKNLVVRSILIWIAVLAVLTLGGWLG